MKKYIPLFCIVICGFWACEKNETTEAVYLGTNYYPSQVGYELIYDVDSIIKDKFTGLTDTFQYQIKERIDSIYIDNEGRPTMRVERYKRNTSNEPWIIHRVWAANKSNTYVHRVEENIRYVKMIFSVLANKKWDGNAFNTLGERIYRYQNAHTPGQVGTFNFDSTLTVLQYEDTTLINKDSYIEKYATNVGMFYKENISIKYNFSPNPNYDTINEAVVYIERLNSYQ
ncbi:MAG TPA: hypothetical protein PKH65_08585 [Bacteroidia bacterium]|nr:hypothetical protein [Bacteroidia bacterium]HNT80722.1 hypothetical protein [Bacteroidia bacterium]